MFPYPRHILLYLVLVQPRKRPDMAENFLTGMAGGSGGGGGGGGGGDDRGKYTKNVFLVIMVRIP